MRHPFRSRRGSVPVEYVVLAGVLAGTVTMGFSLPSAFGQLLVGSHDQMNEQVTSARETRDAGPNLLPNADGSEDHSYEVVEDVDPTNPGEGWGDDPWSGDDAAQEDDPGADGTDDGGQGCNQGLGNGSEGCDPGNSNQGDPANSNDEPCGNGRGHGRKVRFTF
ncbi:MAG: hypothetical protein H6733_14930 [Alphaproteobacteria bacterium]|nr:hypothetical protein [Alphaproteobacteria bacterium]